MLVDYIIPRDERSGSATDAEVPEFMDFMLDDARRTTGDRGIAAAWPGSTPSADSASASAVHRLPPTPSAGRCSTTSPGPRRRQAGDCARAATFFNWLPRPHRVRLLSRARSASRTSSTSATPSWPSGPDAPSRAREAGRQLRLDARVHHGQSGASRRRLHRQRLQRPLPHAGAGRACATPTSCGVWSPNQKNAGERGGAGPRRSTSAPAQAYRSITDMVADPAIDAIWLCGPNQARIENVEEIVRRDRARARAS